MTVIEIRPFRNGWKCFEAPGVEPVFPEKNDAISYSQTRACFRSGEIRVRDQALARVRGEYRSASNLRFFDQMKKCSWTNLGRFSQAEIASQFRDLIAAVRS